MSRRARDILPGLAATVIATITVAPWALGYGADHAAVAGHISFAMAFGPIALLLSVLPAAAAATCAAGAWLAVSPWALGYASLGARAWSADLLAGLLLLVLGAAGAGRGRAHDHAVVGDGPPGSPPTADHFPFAPRL